MRYAVQGIMICLKMSELDKRVSRVSCKYLYKRHGMAGNGRRKKKRGTKVQRTERREKNRHAMMHGGWDGIQSLTMDTRYFTSWPWRVYTFSPRRMKI